MAAVDVVVVAYNSRSSLRECVEPLAGVDDIRVIVVDNASSDDGLADVRDLDVACIALQRNLGFAGGCNVGWQAGDAPFVLFLNPDARTDPASVRRLASRLEGESEAGLVAPRIQDSAGELECSQRRFPRLRSTYAQALFLHRLLPQAGWVDEVIRDPAAYDRPGSPEWVSGACVMARREVLLQVGGLDEGYFHYSEDIDLCRRIRDLGLDVRYEPEALVIHAGGGSAPRTRLLPVLARSRIRYASLHRSRLYAVLERIGVGLGALTHVIVSGGGMPARLGHARSLRAVVARSSQP